MEEDEKYIYVHGYKIRKSSDPLLKIGIKHLEKLDKSEASVFFDKAEKNLVHHKAHLEVRDHNKHKDRNATLIHHGDGSYELKHRSHGLFS